MSAPRRGFTLLELLVVIAIILILLALLGPGYVEVPLYLVFGWVGFLIRVVPQVRASPSLGLTAGVSLAGVLLGVHLFGRWLMRSLPPAPDAGPRRWSFLSTLALVGLVFLMFTAGIGAVGVTHQVGWLANSPEPWIERRIFNHMRSWDNLKQVGLAFHQHDAKAGTFPPAVTFDAQGRALHGWPTLLLPYLEQEALYRKFNLSLPWDHPDNAPHFAAAVGPYLYRGAPDKTADGLPVIHYAMNARLVNGGQPLNLKQLAQGRGAANTILAGEAHGHWRPWGHPVHWRDPALGFNRSPDGFGSPGRPAQSAIFLLADGSVRSFAADTDPEFLALLASPGKADH